MKVIKATPENIHHCTGNIITIDGRQVAVFTCDHDQCDFKRYFFVGGEMLTSGGSPHIFHVGNPSEEMRKEMILMGMKSNLN